MSKKQERQFFLRTLHNATVSGPVYPACRVNGASPYDERVMSLPTQIGGMEEVFEVQSSTVKAGEYLFFIFNFKNYYHFLYDTLPYLVHRKPHMKLLLEPQTFVFQSEILDMLGIGADQYVFAEDGCAYETLHIPSSLTHGKFADGSSASNYPPSDTAYSVWNALKPAVQPSLPKKIYVSRRSWIHGRSDLIGTDYTTRRKCVNEDALVAYLETQGYAEVFCELLSMDMKVAMFQQATHVVGIIGGGMANLLFSPPTTRVGCITTPDFMRVNERFRFSMDHTRISYLPIATHTAFDGPYPLYMRVSVQGRVGEIDDYDGTHYHVKMSVGKVAGFDAVTAYPIEKYRAEELTPLDKGLNSPFVCDIKALERYIATQNESDHSHVGTGSAVCGGGVQGSETAH